MKTDLLDFDDAGATDDHPAKGVTVGHIRKWFDHEERLRMSLRRMTSAFRPFTMRPMGGPGSSARIDQEEQIAAHAEASALSSQQRNTGE